MRISPSIIAIAGCLALGPWLTGPASAKPPEDRIAERAERSAERAAKAAERAAEAAERAAERGERDRGQDRDLADRTADRDPVAGSRDDDRGGGDKTGGRSTGDSSGDMQLASARDSDADDDLTSDGTARDVSGGNEADAPAPSSDGRDLDPNGDDGDRDLNDLAEEDNSGSGSEDDRPDDRDEEDGDSSGSGSDDDDEDEDSDEDSDEDEDGQTKPYGRLENDNAGSPFREGEIVVMSDDAAILQRAEALGFAVIETRELSAIGSVVATLRRPEGVTSAQALDLLRAREPDSPSGYNYIYRSTGPAPDSPLAPLDVTDDALNLVGSIGVIDGFAGDKVAGWAVERLVQQPARIAHGEIVAGILLEDLAGDFGARPDKLLLVDVMRADGGDGSADVAALVLGLDRMATAEVKVVNLSLAGPDHAALRRAVERSVKLGVTLVAAVGNAGPAAPPSFPAAYDGVVGVAAIDSTGRPYIYSGRGPHVDVAALGEVAAGPRAGGQLIGTSYATPHISALLAGARPDGGSVDALLARHAHDAGTPGRDDVYGVGVLMTPSHAVILAGLPRR